MSARTTVVSPSKRCNYDMMVFVLPSRPVKFGKPEIFFVDVIAKKYKLRHPNIAMHVSQCTTSDSFVKLNMLRGGVMQMQIGKNFIKDFFEVYGVYVSQVLPMFPEVSTCTAHSPLRSTRHRFSTGFLLRM